MPPKDTKIGRMNGRLFVPTEDGYQPLPELYETEAIETEEAAPWPKENPVILGVDLAEEASFTGTIYNSEAWRVCRSYIMPMVKLVARLISAAGEALRNYPNQRVVHLALHAKKRRTRKKNMKRIARYYKNKR